MLFIRYFATVIVFGALVWLVIQLIPALSRQLRLAFLARIAPTMVTPDGKFQVFLMTPIRYQTEEGETVELPLTQGIFVIPAGKELVLEVPFRRDLLLEFPRGYLMRKQEAVDVGFRVEYEVDSYRLLLERESPALLEMLRDTKVPDSTKMVEFRERTMTAYFETTKEKTAIQEAIQWIYRVIAWIQDRLQRSHEQVLHPSGLGQVS